jgi:PIN domain nuclease of toxin-antitoxin system
LKAILDTNTFLWWNLDDPRLSVRARNFIAEGNNELYLSAAVAWEIAIKTAQGRLSLPESPDRYVTSRMNVYHFLPLAVQISHALHTFHLPGYHQDPFDRLLIAQSVMENLPILSGDEMIAQYGIPIIW